MGIIIGLGLLGAAIIFATYFAARITKMNPADEELKEIEPYYRETKNGCGCGRGNCK